MVRAFQWDLARQVEQLDWLLAQLPRYADWGYNELYLHLEDAIEYPSLPNVARKDAYTYRQMHRLVTAADRVGIKVVPIVNLLGHTQYLIKVPELRDLNELRAADGSPLERGQICPLHPRTMEIAEKLLRDCAPLCTAGKVHVGLDESFHLGKHPLSRKEIARVGRARHFVRYVERLRVVTQSLGLQMGMWGDMLYFIPDAVALLPRDVAIYEWYYYAFQRRPRVELFNFVETDLGEQLRHRGVSYWGCPMNGAFRYEPLPHFTDRIENIRSWWERCHRLSAAGMLITSWEPNRLAMELTTVVDAAAATLWLDGDGFDVREMLERGFTRVFGRSTAKAATKAALACDRFPFSGYPRWEINSRWDTVSRRESMGPYRREQKHFGALAKRSTLPRPLADSIALRSYLAKRDVFVREVTHSHKRERVDRLSTRSRSWLRLERELAIGMRAAQAMWAATRDPKSRGPNEEILAADLVRLSAVRHGKPLLGRRWQLCYRVHNFEPAAQLVIVEQQDTAGAWHVLQSCHTIEFLSSAARRRGEFTREHAAPVDWNGNPKETPRLRIALRGIGRVRIDGMVLSNGRTTVRVAPRSIVLGKRAPTRGWPNLDWTKNRAVLELRLSSQPKKL